MIDLKSAEVRKETKQRTLVNVAIEYTGVNRKRWHGRREFWLWNKDRGRLWEPQKMSWGKAVRMTKSLVEDLQELARDPGCSDFLLTRKDT